MFLPWSSLFKTNKLHCPSLSTQLVQFFLKLPYSLIHGSLCAFRLNHLCVASASGGHWYAFLHTQYYHFRVLLIVILTSQFSQPLFCNIYLHQVFTTDCHLTQTLKRSFCIRWRLSCDENFWTIYRHRVSSF